MKYILFLFLALPSATLAQRNGGFPAQPANYVTDQEGVLSTREEELLNAKLRAFEDNTSNQVFVYLAGSLNGMNLEDYSQKIFNAWGVGQKDKNNGVLIAIFIKDRRYRIQVGYGLENVLTSELTRQVQDDDMGPHFKERDYYEGIDAGVDQLIYYSSHEFTPKDPNQSLWTAVVVAFSISVLLSVVNLYSLRKWKNQPKRWNKYLLLCAAFLLIPLLGPGLYVLLHSTNIYLLSLLPFAGSLGSGLLCVTINDKDELRFDHETDDAYLRRMHERASSSSSSSSSDSFSGGGGGNTGSGGSSSSW